MNWTKSDFYRLALPVWTAAAGFSLVSWLRYFFTSDIRVDENYPAHLPALLLTFLSLGFTILCFVPLWRWMRGKNRPDLNPKQLLWIHGIALLLIFPMLPAYTNDIFSLLAYGEVRTIGYPAYEHPFVYKGNDWGAYLGERWAGTSNVYGPVALIFGFITTTLGLKGIPAIMVARLLMFLPIIGAMFYKPFFKTNDNIFPPALWFSPFLVLTGTGQVHLDLLIVGFGLFTLMGFERKNFILAGLFTGLAVCTKISALMLGVILLVHLRSLRFRDVAVYGLSVLAVVIPIYGLFWEEGRVLSVPFRELSQLVSGSYVDVLSEIIRVISNGMQIQPPSLSPEEAFAHDLQTKGELWKWMKPLFMGLGMSLCVYSLFRLLRSANDVAWNYAAGAMAAVLCIAMAKFHPWYLMLMFPLFFKIQNRVWQQWFLLTGTIAALQDFAQLMPRDGFLFPFWVASSTFVTLIVFLWKFRARYFR